MRNDPPPRETPLVWFEWPDPQKAQPEREQLTFDAGEVLHIRGEVRSMLRITNELMIRVSPGGSGSTMSELMAPGSPLAGWYRGASVVTSHKLYHPSADHAEMEAAIAWIESHPDVEWAAPVHVDAEAGTRYPFTHDVRVKVADGASPDEFFDERFGDYERVVLKRIQLP